jgi:hypothetical protein
VADINDVVKILKYITTAIHPKIMDVYADEPNRRFILSTSSAFLWSLAAACGAFKHENNMKMLEGALEKLVEELKKPWMTLWA